MLVRVFGRIGIVLSVLCFGGAAAAQEHQHPAPAPVNALVVPEDREGSGTGWLPDATPMFAIHGPVIRGWTTMLHGIAHLQYIRDEEPRGASQFGSINWLMGHARKSGRYGDLALRGMMSLEPLTIRGCGYPDLLASGEVCGGRGIVDRQHPHDLIMEVAAVYGRSFSDRVGLQLYGGLAGEPALGPVAFPHRPSALLNPIAPIAHHWLDATHITYGVVTGGVHGRRWKVESSLFNGREPDEERYDLDLAAFDSYSGRIAWLPTPRWSLQLSAGHLEDAEEDGPARVDVNRVTASAIHHQPREGGGLLATTVAWGRNVEEGNATHALLAETTLSLDDRQAIFGRAEIVQKTSHDLDLHDAADDIYSVGKLQVGYSRFFAPVRGWRPGVGGSVSLSVLPDRLAPVYGGRAPVGVAVFLTLRPAAMAMSTAARP